MRRCWKYLLVLIQKSLMLYFREWNSVVTFRQQFDWDSTTDIWAGISLSVNILEILTSGDDDGGGNFTLTTKLEWYEVILTVHWAGNSEKFIRNCLNPKLVIHFIPRVLTIIWAMVWCVRGVTLYCVVVCWRRLGMWLSCSVFELLNVWSCKLNVCNTNCYPNLNLQKKVLNVWLDQ